MDLRWIKIACPCFAITPPWYNSCKKAAVFVQVNLHKCCKKIAISRFENAINSTHNNAICQAVNNTFSEAQNNPIFLPSSQPNIFATDKWTKRSTGQRQQRQSKKCRTATFYRVLKDVLDRGKPGFLIRYLLKYLRFPDVVGAHKQEVKK